MFSARELILEGKAEPGDTVGLLWRDELRHPFTQRITFDGEGKAVSGPCTATRIEGGWRLVDSGNGDGKGADTWDCMDDHDPESLQNCYTADGILYYMPCGAGGAPATPAGAAAARPEKKPRTGAASLKGIYRWAPRAAAPLSLHRANTCPLYAKGGRKRIEGISDYRFQCVCT